MRDTFFLCVCVCIVNGSSHNTNITYKSVDYIDKKLQITEVFDLTYSKSQTLLYDDNRTTYISFNHRTSTTNILYKFDIELENVYDVLLVIIYHSSKSNETELDI